MHIAIGIPQNTIGMDCKKVHKLLDLCGLLPTDLSWNNITSYRFCGCVCIFRDYNTKTQRIKIVGPLLPDCYHKKANNYKVTKNWHLCA